MKKLGRILNLAMVVFLVALLGVAMNPGISGAQETKTLKIDVITALSGAGAEWGRGILHGAEMAADDAKAKGGLAVGGQKYNIEIVSYDDKYTAAGGAAAVNKAVFSDQVKFIIGSISSASVLTMQETTEPNKILLLCDSWAVEVLSPKKPYSFRMFMTSTQAAPGVVRTVQKLWPKAKKVVTVAANDASGWSIGADYDQAYQKAGFEVSKELPERTTKDYYPLLTRIKAQDPDIIQECAIGVGAAALLTKQSKELGLRAHVVGGAWIDPDVFVKTAGGNENAEGYVYPIVFDRNSTDPKVQEFIKKFQAKYGDREPVLTPDMSFYDGTRLFFAALEKAGTVTDTDKVKAALESIKEFPGTMGPMTWTGKETYGIDHQIQQAMQMAQIQKGKEVIIEKKP